jgi:hypothetical protein
LCLQLRLYKDGAAPFDLEFADGYEEPINWWNLIDTSPNPDSLPTIARHLFSICPNSASCERGFSSLGWLTNKWRLRLGVEKLESMSKMITYWKSNAEKEFGFYGKNLNGKQKMSQVELNIKVIEALAASDDFEDEELEGAIEKRTIDGELVPDDNVIVLIESMNIEKDIDLTNKIILDNIGEVPENDIIDNSDIEENEDSTGDEYDNGNGIMDYDLNDLINEYGNDN